MSWFWDQSEAMDECASISEFPGSSMGAWSAGMAFRSHPRGRGGVAQG